MARFNATKSSKKSPSIARSLPAGAHLNWMGGPSYDVRAPLVRLRIAAASCFFGEPMYYHADEKAPKPPRTPAPSLTDAQRTHLRDTLRAIDPVSWRASGPSELLESAIDEALEYDAEATLQLAVWLRAEEHVRTTPQVMLVRAAHHPKVRGTGLVRRYAPSIVRRADEPAVGLAYQLWRYGKPVPNALKRAWADALRGFSAYELAKYRLEARAVKTVDVVNLVHAKSPHVDALAKSSLTTTDETWESIISARGSNTSAWREALPKMGHMALLRNLRNLAGASIPAAEWTDRLVEGARKGQQLPFRYFSAYRAVKGAPNVSGAALDAIERCLETSLGNLPHLTGRVMSLCDNSGSARGATTSSMGSMAVATIANLTGVLAAKCADDGHVGVFGDKLSNYVVRRSASVMQQLEEVERLGENVGAGTENGVWLFWDKAIREREHWDTVFIFSDMQAGHGGLYGTDPKKYAEFKWNGSEYIDVPMLIAAYRARVNPKVNVFLVQVAGYKDTLVPEFYERTYILGGWGEGLLRFAAEMADVAEGREIPAAS
jgi:TROVE domain